MAHTKGWTWEPEVLSEFGTHIAGRGPVVRDGKRLIARIESGLSTRDRNAAERTARLFAAAPEMLEALKHLTTLIHNMEQLYQNDAAKWLISKPAFVAAETVIRKAEQG